MTAWTPAAEVDIDLELIDTLVRSQHPDLAGDLEFVASGWDNVVVRLGTSHVVRMPRRALSAPLVRHEARWLPTLAPLLPVAVPVAVRTGVPGCGYPFDWLICPWFDGVPVSSLGLADRRGLAADVAAAHLALHRPAPANAPQNPFRGVPLALRDDAVEERLRGDLPRARELRTLWRRGLEVPEYRGEPRWLHGDPHPGNLLATTGGTDARLAAIIDFGDITAGDPATDLAIAWLAFDAVGRAGYRSALGADEESWARTGWAVCLATALLSSSDDSPVLRGVGLHAVRQLLDEPET